MARTGTLASMAQRLLEVNQLGCVRGDRPLFGDLSFTLSAGQLAHVVGRNGSGKTTLLRTLCGLSQPASGEIRWRNAPIAALGDEYRAQLSYVGHQDGVHGELTAAENLGLANCLVTGSHPGAIDAALERLGIDAARALPAKLLSQGQRRRLALARLLVARTPLWILDEPFTALDAAASALLQTLLHEHLSGGGSAVLSSHRELSLPGAKILLLDLDHRQISAPAYAAGRV